MKKLAILTASAIAALCLPSAAQAQTVSVQFPSYYSNPYNDLNGSAGGGNTPTVTAGVVPAANWNAALGNANVAGSYQNTPNSFVGGNGAYTTDITNNNLYNWILNPAPGSAYTWNRRVPTVRGGQLF
jgi:opacity protein-like surface antigen